MKSIFKSALPVLLLLCTTLAQAVTLPSFFADNMVLQQKSTVPIFGSTKAKKVTVTSSWDKKKYEVFAKAGKWEVFLTTPSYGGPYTITIDDGTKTELKNILIGEVWLCSGQSNMEMPLAGWGKINNYQEEISNANYPEIRLLQAEHVTSVTPLDDLKLQKDAGWMVCSPQTIADFSSTAYFFARKVWEEKHIPIGLIHSSWGGTVAEAWTSTDALRTMGDFDETLDALADESGNSGLQKKYDNDLAKWNALLVQKDATLKNGKPAYANADFNDSGWGDVAVPSFYEHNVLPNFDGVVWYRKTFELAKVPAQDGVFEFTVDDDDMVWVNGMLVGQSKGYLTGRSYKIPTSLLKKGTNVITLRCFDSGGNGGIYAPDDIAVKFGSDKVSLAGTWKYKVSLDLKEMPPMPRMPMGANRPSVLYNAMIHPLLRYKLAGVIWYQGESNAERAQQYQTLFPLMINNWRTKFKNSKLPFYFVQLANFKEVKTEPGNSEWAELREAQFKTLKQPLTGMAVITDIGDAVDIHPKNKQDVGKRLALIALDKIYGVKTDYSGPLFTDFKKVGTKIAVSFAFNNGLKPANGTELKGFEIAGEDKVFHWATATVESGRVVVTSADVKSPVAVRYNWADNPQGNLTNASGLPASSFRTDSWPGITDGKK